MIILQCRNLNLLFLTKWCIMDLMKCFWQVLQWDVTAALEARTTSWQKKFIKMQELFLNNRLSEAQTLQSEINKIIQILSKVGVMAGEKEILCQMGLDFGCARKPFTELDTTDKKLIRENIMPLL